jgi:hypothetical protein
MHALSGAGTDFPIVQAVLDRAHGSQTDYEVHSPNVGAVPRLIQGLLGG